MTPMSGAVLFVLGACQLRDPDEALVYPKVTKAIVARVDLDKDGEISKDEYAQVAFPDEPLRVIVHRMAMSGLTRFPVVEPGADRRLVGVISLEDLLKARVHNLEAEHRRERILRVRIAFPFGLERTKV